MKAAPGLCGGKCGSEAPAQVANGTDHAVGGHQAVVDRGQGAVDLVTLGLALLGFEGQLLGSILALATESCADSLLRPCLMAAESSPMA